MTRANGPQSWQGLLVRDEEILWQGRPGKDIAWGSLLGPQTLMGVFFTGFSLFWISSAASMTGQGNAPFPFQFFPLFGLPFLGIGLYMVGGHAIWDVYVRSTTHYTLTTQNAFVARGVLGKRTLESHPINQMSRIVLEDGTPGSVIFGEAQLHRRGNRSRATVDPIPPGFHQIKEARAVYAQLRQAQHDLKGQSS